MIAMIEGDSDSYCLSVCLYICVSFSMITDERLKLGSPNLVRMT